MFHASMTFDLGEDVNALRGMVHDWAQNRVKPLAAEIDQSNSFPPALWPEMGELGLLGVTVDEDYGGGGVVDRKSTRVKKQQTRKSEDVFWFKKKKKKPVKDY